tara:strand:- start:238 stop:1080 length:843 start_codon:yes stop_codon:yes gene_type:complete
MAKTLRTLGDYTVKTGDGSSGLNSVILDSRYTRIKGDLIVDGDQTQLNTSTLSIEDPFIEVIRNNSGIILDGGIYINRGTAGDNAVMYWDESGDIFRFATTTDSASTSPLTNTTLARLQIGTPVDGADAATKNYVLQQVSGGSYAISLSASGLSVAVPSGAVIEYISGSSNQIISIDGSTTAVTFDLNNDLTNITSITSDASNGDLTLTANGTGEIVLNDILTFTVGTANPTATASTKMYNKTAAGGGTGLYFKNSNIDSGAEGELISKKKATALAIALG